MQSVANNSIAEVQLVECPRDAMQGWKKHIPAAQKIDYLNQLLQVGFHTLDFGSFVSPKAIPQMADTKEVLQGLNLALTSTKLLAIVANVRGAEEAVAFDAITYLGFPFSLSPTFQQRNAGSSIEEAVQRVDAIQELCIKHGKELVLYLSMAFGNPYGDDYSAENLLSWTETMAAKQIKIVSLADTVGLATPEQITQAFETVIPTYRHVTFGAHLHATQTGWQQKIEAAYAAGCRRFDGALLGIGGCPMAGNDLVGNIATEQLISFIESKDEPLQMNKAALTESLLMAGFIFGQA